MTKLNYDVVITDDVPTYETYEPTLQDRFDALKHHAEWLMQVKERGKDGLYGEGIHDLLWCMAENKIEFMIGPDAWPVLDKRDMN